MRHISIVVPIITTAILTATCVFLALWLTGLVPAGEWAGLIKAIIVMFIIGCALVAIAWSAYFTWVIRKSIEENK